MPKKSSGKQSVEVRIEGYKWDLGSWFFCQNGRQSTGVDVSPEQFDMLKELVNRKDVIEFYKAKRDA